MRLISKKILDSAKGRRCTFRIPEVCNNDPDTTVFCHAPDPTRGKGTKTNDHWGAYGCHSCHSKLDHFKVEERNKRWLNAIRETQNELIKAGLIIVAETTPKPRKPKKPETPVLGGVARQYGL